MPESLVFPKDPGTYVGEPVLDYVKPPQLVESMIEAGASKGTLPLGQLFVRGMLGGAFLAYGTSMAFLGIAQGMIPILAGALFPLGFVVINLIQADLATGYFCYVPLALIHRRITFMQLVRAFCWVYVANLVGSLVYVFILWAALTMCGNAPDTSGIGAVLVKTGTVKSLHYEPYGAAGWVTAFLKGVLCNWFVTLGVILPMTTRSAIGRAIATFVPIYLFFGMGWEHLVVNMFILPSAMLFGAHITLGDWWFWNEIPVTIGNFCGGFFFTGLAVGWAYYARQKPDDVLPPLAQPARV